MLFLLNKILLIIFFSVTIYLAIFWAPTAKVLNETTRFLYIHVPLAWLSVVSFFISGLYSIIYLKNKNIKHEIKFHNAAQLGIFLVFLTILTGAIWAKLRWGMYWNWDPRQISITILLLFYLAYFALRSATEGKPNRGALSASYLILAFITVPFCMFIIPRLYPSLHPNTIINKDGQVYLNEKIFLTLIFSLFTFTFLFFYIYLIRNKFMLKKIDITKND